jgi:hypothetical protein
MLPVSVVSFFMLFFLCQATAQSSPPLEKDTAVATEKESYFKLNVNYLSNAIYSGRKDSAVVPYLRSSLGYYNKWGFYADAGASLLVSANDAKRIDLVTLEAGYAFAVSKKLEGSVSASKFFYTDQSYAVQSELKGMAGADLGYDAGVVAINAGADLLFSTNTDIFTSLKLSHYFEMGPETRKWSITPSVEMNAGTQYYNQAYYKNRKFSFATAPGTAGGSASTQGKGHAHSSGSGTGNGAIKTVVFNDTNQFTVLDYEMSLPVVYETRSWGLYATPTVALPVHAASYAVDGVLQKEALSNSFFIEVGVFGKLHPHHKRV